MSIYRAELRSACQFANAILPNRKYFNSPLLAFKPEMDQKYFVKATETFFAKNWPADDLVGRNIKRSAHWYTSERIWFVATDDGAMDGGETNNDFGISIALIEGGKPVLAFLGAVQRAVWTDLGQPAVPHQLKPVRH